MHLRSQRLRSLQIWRPCANWICALNQAKIVFRNKKAATQTSHGRKLKYKRFNKNQKAHTEVIILYLITISVFITRIKCTSLSLRFFISIQSVAKYLFKCNDIFANHPSHTKRIVKHFILSSISNLFKHHIHQLCIRHRELRRYKWYRLSGNAFAHLLDFQEIVLRNADFPLNLFSLRKYLVAHITLLIVFNIRDYMTVASVNIQSVESCRLFFSQDHSHVKRSSCSVGKSNYRRCRDVRAMLVIFRNRQWKRRASHGSVCISSQPLYSES